MVMVSYKENCYKKHKRAKWKGTVCLYAREAFITDTLKYIDYKKKYF